MDEIAGREIGCRGSVNFKVGQIDAVAADVDLLVVGMFEPDNDNQPIGGADQLDRVLHGTLGRLRAGGIFTGAVGEQLTLATPPAPISPRSLMLLGLGSSITPNCAAIGRSTELAMRSALRMRARSVGCLLAWLERDIPSELVEACATTMMEGALQAIEDHESSGEPFTLDWIFDARNEHAGRTEAALKLVLDTVSRGD